MRGSGIRTLGELARSDPESLPTVLGPATRQRLVEQARLQAVQRATGMPRYELLPAEPRHGLARLPEPSHGDLFLDLEGDPHVGEHGLEYLFGLCDAEGRFTAYWARTPEEEKEAFERTVDHVMRAWRLDPGDARLPLRAL